MKPPVLVLVALALASSSAAAEVSASIAAGFGQLRAGETRYQGPVLDLGATVTALNVPLTVGFEYGLRPLSEAPGLIVDPNLKFETLVFRAGTELEIDAYAGLAFYVRPELRGAWTAFGAHLLSATSVGARYTFDNNISVFAHPEVSWPILSFLRNPITVPEVGFKAGVRFTFDHPR